MLRLTKRIRIGELRGEVKMSLEIGIVRRRVHGVGCATLSLLLWSQLCPDLLRYGVGDLTLQLQHIAEIAVIGFCPEMPVGAGLEELRGDPHALPGTNDRSLHDRVYIQLPRDFGQALFCALVADGGGSR